MTPTQVEIWKRLKENRVILPVKQAHDHWRIPSVRVVACIRGWNQRPGVDHLEGAGCKLSAATSAEFKYFRRKKLCKRCFQWLMKNADALCLAQQLA